VPAARVGDGVVAISATAGTAGAADDTRPVHERIGELRRELNRLVAANHHRTGRPHGVIHSELRRTCGGPPTGQASATQLQARIETLRRWEQ
jgi:hypothetical protein